MQKSEKNLAKLSKPICGGAHFKQAVVGYKFGEKNSHIVLSIILLSFDIISYDSLGTGSVYTTNAKKKKDWLVFWKIHLYEQNLLLQHFVKEGVKNK